MSDANVATAIDALAIGMVILGVGLVWTRSSRQAIALVALQSVLLGGVAVAAAFHAETKAWHLLVSAGLVLVVKAGILPVALRFLIVRARANGAMPFAVPRPYAVALAVGTSLVIIESFNGDPFSTPLGAERALPAAVALILLGLQTMVTRHHVVAQITGFLAIENGMALAALTATYGMPLVIEFGVLLDVLLAVMVAFMYFRRIDELHGELATRVLRGLRG
jgi:hydrogenase-4 component E